MKIRRLTITLPARMRHTAQHDARAIAEAVAQQLHANGGDVRAVRLEGHGHSGAHLATRVALSLPRPSGAPNQGGNHGR